MKKEKIFSVLRLNTGLSEPFERLETVLEMGEKGHNISIGFSIDAASYDCYKRIKGGELDRLKDSIIRFLQKRRALRLEYRIFVDLLFLITPENHHEALPFLNFWRKELAGLQYRVHFPDMPGPLGARTGILFQPAAGKDKGQQEQLNQLYFETMTKISAFAHYHHKLYLPLPDGSVQEFCVNMEKDQLFKLNLGILPLPRDLRPPCSSAIEGPFSISPQGDIRICTHYLSDDGILGNINQGFLQVITGTKGSGFLQNFMDGIFENHCDYCIFPEYSDFEGHWVPPYDLAGARYYWWRYKMYKTALAAFLFAEKKSIPDPNIPMAINILKKALEKS